MKFVSKIALAACAVTSSSAGCSGALSPAGFGQGARLPEGSDAVPPTAVVDRAAAFSPPGGTCAKIADTLHAAGGQLPLPKTSGFSGTLTFPHNDAPAAGVMLDFNFCPGGAPPAAVKRTVIEKFFAEVGGTPIAWVELAPLAHDLTFKATTSAFALTVPAGAFPPHGAATRYYVGGCDESYCDRLPVTRTIPDIVGPLDRSGSTLSLSSTAPILKGVQPPPSLTAPPGWTELAFIYASPYSPLLQYRRVRAYETADR
jgi:hypothetical protein